MKNRLQKEVTKNREKLRQILDVDCNVLLQNRVKTFWVLDNEVKKNKRLGKDINEL